MLNKFRFLTSGESHGPKLNIIIEGLPSGLELLPQDINTHLKRRQGGYGRGLRMKIETDKANILGGIRHGETLGSPIGLEIINKDHEKWLNIMNPEPIDLTDTEIQEELADKYRHTVRPGHADYAGAIKYRHQDIRNVLERSSARETTSRVAAGSIARKLLTTLGIEVYSHIIQIGEISLPDELTGDITPDEWTNIENSPVRCKDAKISQDICNYIDQSRTKGETIGGIVELIVKNLPVGIGSYTHWDKRLDGLISWALMSTHTVKSVSFGIGEQVGRTLGSNVHDQIELDQNNNTSNNLRYSHLTNRAGGIEGGMSNGEDLIIRVAMKPIPTLARTEENSLKSVNLTTKTDDKAFYERSDICVVPAGGVVLESMLSIVLADQILHKFGSDNIEELKLNYQNYLEYCSSR